ncbi:MAG: ABC transporter permease, partial [Planctomycetes bacterium]|nr:ABC transporter permease [Planctomycetota bacterium]
MTIAAPDAAVLETPSRPRGAIMEFVRQQPLGTVSFVIIVAMMFAGIFSEFVAPYDPLEIDFA